MVEELGTAYRCNECHGVIIGTLQQAQAHEQIPFGPEPVRGLVFRKIFEQATEVYLYGIILKSAGKMSNNSKVLEESLHPYHHAYLYDLLSLYHGNESILFEIKTDDDQNYKSLSRRFQKGDARFLNDAEFADFLKMFSQMDKLKRERLKPEDLVQKVEYLEQKTTATS